MADLNWALIAPLIAVQFILMSVALFDLVRVHATNGPKWMWALIIIFVNLVGPVVYFIFGRRTV